MISNQLQAVPKAVLQEYYKRYLLDVRQLSMSSVRHYFDALNNISRRLKAMNLVTNDIYEIDSLEELEKVRDILYADKDFVELNERGRRMYSAGLNNYYRFASGGGFHQVKDKIILLDVPVQREEQVSEERTKWKRSGIIRQQALEIADYTCEIDGGHKTFIAERTYKPYMEGHHVIPMQLQERFQNSLDIYANLVCLCPVCHRMIHYGVKKDKQYMLNQIYSDRGERLANSGIVLSRDEFVDMVISI